MENGDFNNLFDNMRKFAFKISDEIDRIQVSKSLSESLSLLADFFQNIPDDIKETQLFKKVQDLKKKNLYYEDVVWLIEDFGVSYSEKSWKKILEGENKSELHRYISKIILSTSIEKREKIIILLAHIEPLIYDTLNMSRVTNSKLKNDVKKVSIHENEGMSRESLEKIYVLAVFYIVFAGTDYYTEKIDNRLPFRNNILHNGIVTYSDGDIEIAYELLVNLIEILVEIKKI